VSVAPIPSAPADLEFIAQLKSKLQYAELRIRVLEERLRLMRIQKYGAGGEKLSQAQMQLFELEPVVSEMIEEAESEHAPVHRPTKRSTRHPGRQKLPANLPRVERILPCTPDQRLCKHCGRETVVIGYEETSQLDVEPAKYFVLVTKREKRACRWCEVLGVVSAPPLPRIIEKCLASDRIVIDTVVSKYCNHTPLHRQSMNFLLHLPRDSLGLDRRCVSNTEQKPLVSARDPTIHRLLRLPRNHGNPDRIRTREPSQCGRPRYKRE
jgi:transposase